MAANEFSVEDESFRRRVRMSAFVERHFDGCRWAEGPVYFPAHRSLIWSDIPNDRMLRFDECSGTISEFRRPSNFSNGNTRDREGRLVTCEQGTRRVTRTEHDGSVTVLADRFEGSRLNSPNDVVVARDGSVWFTDPSYGIDSDYEGHRAERESDGCHVYRIDPSSGAVRKVADDFAQPNGLAFSPDGARLLVVDSGGTHMPDGPRHIRSFEVMEGGRLRGGAVFATCTADFFDGFRFDSEGRIWAGAGDGVHCLDPAGELIGKVLVPEPVANVCFGGERGNRLFICATRSLYSVFLAVTGA